MKKFILKLILTIKNFTKNKEREQREQREQERMKLLEQANKGDESAYQQYVTFDMDR